MKNKTIIWGAGGHASVVADAIKACGDELLGFIDTVTYTTTRNGFLGLPVWNGIAVALADKNVYEIEIAFGFGHCAARLKGYNLLHEMGISVKQVVHPAAVVSTYATLGQGVYVAPNAVVEAGCVIGDVSIINTSSVVCHGSKIHQAVAICPGVLIGGNVDIGSQSWIGIGSVIKDRVCIGEKCFIGAGALVLKDIQSGFLAYGVPAKEIQEFKTAF